MNTPEVDIEFHIREAINRIQNATCVNKAFILQPLLIALTAFKESEPLQKPECKLTMTPNGNTVPKEPWDSGLPLFDLDCNIHGRLTTRNTRFSIAKIAKDHQ